VSSLEPRLWRWGESVSILDQLWASGGVVAIPTESTFGLAVDPADPAAVDTVFSVKGRSAGQALPIVAGTVGALERLGVRLDLPEFAPVLAAWPAPLTLVAPLERPLPAASGMDTLAVRIPDHGQLRELLTRLGRTVTATSANRSGEAPATRVEQVSSLLAGEEALVIDEAGLPGGEPSTIVGMQGGRLAVLREGRFPVARLFGA